MGRRYLTRQEWKAYVKIIKKELRGEKVSKTEVKLQQKGDAEIKKSYTPMYQ